MSVTIVFEAPKPHSCNISSSDPIAMEQIYEGTIIRCDVCGTFWEAFNDYGSWFRVGWLKQRRLQKQYPMDNID